MGEMLHAWSLANMAQDRNSLTTVRSDVYDLPCDWKEMLSDVRHEMNTNKSINRFEIVYDDTYGLYIVSYYFEN